MYFCFCLSEDCVCVSLWVVHMKYDLGFSKYHAATWQIGIRDV